MKTKILIILTLFAFQLNYSQKTVKMTTEYGIKNRELLEILSFQNLGIETLTFESQDIKGKYYEISIKEYKKGALTNTKILFDGSDSEYFKIDSTIASFKFFTQIENKKLKTYIKGKGFGSRKDVFNLKSKTDDYTVKDFMGIKKTTDVPLNEEFPILAIITPTLHEDGSASWCEVAQSEVSKDQYYEKFKIPHYFIITMRFKQSTL